MTQRRIFKTKSVGSVVLKELMQNIFVAELLNPSQKLVWIVSPWVSDVRLIDNRGGNFDIVNPDWRGQIVNLQLRPYPRVIAAGIARQHQAC